MALLRGKVRFNGKMAGSLRAGLMPPVILSDAVSGAVESGIHN